MEGIKIRPYINEIIGRFYEITYRFYKINFKKNVSIFSCFFFRLNEIIELKYEKIFCKNEICLGTITFRGNTPTSSLYRQTL